MVNIEITMAQDKEQERLAKTWDAVYRIYVKFPSQKHYDLMCQAYDELVKFAKGLVADAEAKGG